MDQNIKNQIHKNIRIYCLKQTHKNIIGYNDSSALVQRIYWSHIY